MSVDIDAIFEAMKNYFPTRNEAILELFFQFISIK